VKLARTTSYGRRNPYSAPSIRNCKFVDRLQHRVLRAAARLTIQVSIGTYGTSDFQDISVGYQFGRAVLFPVSVFIRRLEHWNTPVIRPKTMAGTEEMNGDVGQRIE
jgi:hypothetical protein